MFGSALYLVCAPLIRQDTLIGLVAIAIPSFRLLYLQRDIPQADMTIKVIGNPGWNWTYQYPDLGVDESGEAKVSFTASLLPEDQAKAQNRPYLLATDVPVVVPVNKTVKVIVTSDPAGIFSKFTALPIQIYQWTARPQDEFRNLAAAAILVLLVLLLGLNAAAILLRNRYGRQGRHL